MFGKKKNVEIINQYDTKTCELGNEDAEIEAILFDFETGETIIQYKNQECIYAELIGEP